MTRDRALVLDIETVPLAAALEAPYPEGLRQPPANYKSEEAIAKWRAADQLKWEEERVKECSLNPRLGRILCVGTSEGVALGANEADEREVLRQAWAWLKEFKGQVVTWNGSWDLRCLMIRSLAHGITPTLPPSITRVWFRKYATFPHFDCKAVLTNWDAPRAGEGLTEWARFLGLPGKIDGITGKDVWPLYCGGLYDEIAEYCQQDVAATQAVYERIVPFFF